ncbi:hypothetical protein M495_23260 [Serratia liquefaciens ATCC 27592]|jgi:hypothetical protein|nr:hypothetical protein M495_23260 [Serratia liquefaciens ATCC 27592]
MSYPAAGHNIRRDDADNQNNDWRDAQFTCAQTLTKTDLDHIVR